MLPGLHSWFHFHHLVRHVHNPDGDLPSLWVALALQEVIDPGLKETAQLRLRQSCLDRQNHSETHFLVLVLRQKHSEGKITLWKTSQQPDNY